MTDIKQRVRKKYRCHGLLAVILSGLVKVLPKGLVNTLTGGALLLTRNVYEVRDVRVNLGHETVDATMAARLLRGYESDEVRFVNAHLPSDIAVIEMGGGIGYVSCVIQFNLDDDTPHHVLEPNPELLDALEANRSLNDADFVIHDLAYDPIQQSVPFFTAEVPTGGSTKIDRGNGLSVPATSLQELGRNLDVEEFTLVCDIERAEVQLLEEEMQYLEGRCKMIILEWHVSEERLRSLLTETSFSELDRRNGVYVLVNDRL